MNEPINAGKPWTQDEMNMLNKHYNIDKLDIMKIADLHQRNPTGIISRLKVLNYIPDNESARGYHMYKNSEIYKEKMIKRDENKEKRYIKRSQLKDNNNTTNTNINNILITINKDDYDKLQNDVTYLRNEVSELKTMVKELVSMMNAVYDFEE